MSIGAVPEPTRRIRRARECYEGTDGSSFNDDLGKLEVRRQHPERERDAPVFGREAKKKGSNRKGLHNRHEEARETSDAVFVWEGAR